MTFTKPQQLLIDALRSGEYEQCVGQLATEEGGFCVLGVGCDLAVKNGIITQFDGNDTNLVNYPTVQDWLGLVDCEGAAYSISDGDGVSLQSLNENGVSFSEIGERIATGDLEDLFIQQMFPTMEVFA